MHIKLTAPFNFAGTGFAALLDLALHMPRLTLGAAQRWPSGAAGRRAMAGWLPPRRLQRRARAGVPPGPDHDAVPSTPCDVQLTLHRMVRIARTLVAPGVRITERRADVVSPQPGLDNLHQVVLHLILDAAQALRGHGDIDVALRCVDGMAVVTVSDTRASLSPARLLMAPLFGAAAASHEECSRLGLLMARDFTDEHGGTASTTRTAGGGHAVTLSWPLAQPIAAHRGLTTA